MKRDDRRYLTLALILFLATHFYPQFNSWIIKDAKPTDLSKETSSDGLTGKRNFLNSNVSLSPTNSSVFENRGSPRNVRFENPVDVTEAKFAGDVEVAIEEQTVISMTWKYSNHTYISGYPQSIWDQQMR